MKRVSSSIFSFDTMRAFVRDVVVFCGINFAVLAYLYGIYDVPSDYLAAVNDKLDRLAEKPSPRLIFVGGSSVAWSNHSKLAQAAFPNFSVENLAFHAGLGFAIRLEEVRKLTQPGDVVVLSIEWGVFKDEPWARKMAETFMACPRYWQFMTARDKKLVCDGLLPALRIPVAAFIDDAKQHGLAALTHASAQNRKRWRLRENFNELGDFVGHYEEPAIGIEGKTVEFATNEQLRQSVGELNLLYETLQTRGVQAYYFIPIIAESRYQQLQAVADPQLGILRRELEIPILNPDDFTFPDTAYFDSCYHMRGEAGGRRTKLLVEYLASKKLADK